MLSRREVLGGAAALGVAGLALGVLGLRPTGSGGETYRFTDQKGVVHYVQGLDNVPERYRDPRLTPAEREAALEAVKALRNLESLADPAMKSFEYGWRLRKLEEVVPKSLRAMKRGPVAAALAGALSSYRLAGRLIERGVAASHERPAGAGQPCQRLARPLVKGEPPASPEERTAALQGVWRCAAERTTAAETLMLHPGGGPWAERVKTPPKTAPKP